jgi:hypothetical protein
VLDEFLEATQEDEDAFARLCSLSAEGELRMARGRIRLLLDQSRSNPIIV